MPRTVALPQNEAAFSFSVQVPDAGADVLNFSGTAPMFMTIRHNDRDGNYYFEIEADLDTLVDVYHLDVSDQFFNPTGSDLNMGDLFAAEFGVSGAPTYRFTGKLVTNWPILRLLPTEELSVILDLVGRAFGQESDPAIAPSGARPDLMLVDERAELSEPDLGELTQCELLVFGPAEYVLLRWMDATLLEAGVDWEEFDTIEAALEYIIKEIL